MKNSQTSVSLSEVHGSVNISKNYGMIKRFLAFAGPAYLISVGYMDPGNWATDIEGGSRFGYQLLWVILMSNMMAVLLQTLSARLGIVTGRDLAQACRDEYPKPVVFVLWILCEVAIAACDLAELLGTAIGLNLLFGLPLLIGVLVTGFDTMLFLVIQNFGIRKMEFFIIMLVSVMGVCFGIEMLLSKPVLSEVANGFLPRLNSESLFVAIGILGATVMPHNLYLHSALVQTRLVEQTEQGKRQACKFNLIDTSIALNAAFLVNAAILIVSSSVFFKNGLVVTEIQQAHSLLAPLLGTTLASTLFAGALLASGQSSTLTGTYAGQIVMEGFLHFKMRPVLRRFITRAIAIVPAIAVIYFRGDQGSYELLILSQVVLSMQLPFAIIPLINFTSDKERMGVFVNKPWVKSLAWIAAIIIVGLNARLVFGTITDWIKGAGSMSIIIWMTFVPIIVGLFLFLIYITLPKTWRRRELAMPSEIEQLELVSHPFTNIGVALDLSGMDSKVLSQAKTLAQQNGARLVLMHVVEGVGGQLFGVNANDDEARDDRAHLENHAEQLRATGLEVQAVLGFGRIPKEIIRLSIEQKIDLLVMGGHGHRGIKDIIFGTSISKVRHGLKVPVLVVQ
ncbi:MAG: Nramp family divalent metal transporter [Ignavibacteriales bacterium]|nr:Nramp family divalent metal transporter [Ignavibacteriales bacterium]